MKITKNGIILLVLLSTAISGCSSSSGNEPPAPTPLKELTATEFFNKISPSIAYVETPTGAGSGLLIDSGYIVTCAHVIWPFEDISVAFPNGSTSQAKVLDYDLMADIAVLEPVTTNISPLSPASQVNLSTGNPVFAIGYPGENEEHLQPTLTQGIISTTRNWDTLNLTYIQTDAATTFGQSGGGLFSNKGELLGMTGYFYYGDNFALAISSADLMSRVERLISGEDVDGLGSRQVPSYGGDKEQSTYVGPGFLGTFIIRQPEDTEIEIEANSKEAFVMYLTDIYGSPIDYDSSNTIGKASLSAITEYDAPYFLSIIQYEKDIIQLTSNCDLIPLEDPDDGNYLHIGNTLSGSIDYPGDMDYYEINLLKDDRIHITADSLMINPCIGIYPSNFLSLKDSDLEDSTWFDDDSGGGLFGTDAYIELTAPKDGLYSVVVADCYSNSVGGYTITIEW